MHGATEDAAFPVFERVPRHLLVLGRCCTHARGRRVAILLGIARVPLTTRERVALSCRESGNLQFQVMRCFPAGATATATISGVLRRCVPLAAIGPGKQVHAHVLTRGLLPHITVETDLVLLYSRCSVLASARWMFDNMPQKNMHSWNILISAYVQNSLHGDALRLLPALMESGFRADHFTFPPLFKACAAIGDLCVGASLHGWVVTLGLDGHVVVGCSLLDMYAKCGRIMDAHWLFVNMCNKDVVAYNSMISGLARAEMSSEALSLFRTMQWEGMEMDPLAVPSVLNACGHVGDLRKGKEIHGKLVRRLVVDSDTTVGNSLIDMYGKCGCLDGARRFFSRMLYPNLVTWTTLISCCAVHGKGKESLVLYDEMVIQGFKPNLITFTSILSSCSHSGLISEGWVVFESMSTVHTVEPGAEHYACMVNLLGRSGDLKEALNLIKNMPMEPTASIWGALLGACVVHKDVEIAEIAAQRLFDLEPRNASNYIALCSIYDALGTRDGVLKIRAKMRELGLMKAPGRSCITIEGRVYTFYQGDTSHSLATRIYDTLEGLVKTMGLSEGYG